MKFTIVMLLLLLVATGCNIGNNLKPNNYAKIVSGNIQNVQSYNVPKGEFRGVLWPSADVPELTIWVIKNKQESFFKVNAPQEISGWEKETTELWQIVQIEKSNNSKRYSAKKSDAMVPIIFQLPLTKRPYNFAVLADEKGNESILFMDIAEQIVAPGIFGYFNVKTNN